jgi:hypothetical protein
MWPILRSAGTAGAEAVSRADFPHMRIGMALNRRYADDLEGVIRFGNGGSGLGGDDMSLGPTRCSGLADFLCGIADLSFRASAPTA